ncbi:MAG: hypothetical protein R3A80_04825 [Bdellovibrionota bacterium]
MKKIAIATAMLSVSLAQAGSLCMAETYSGKLATVSMNTSGVYGSFNQAAFTFKDKDGTLLMNETYKSNAQFAETMRSNQAMIVLSVLNENTDVHLNYLGTDYSEQGIWDAASLEKVLKDPTRVKDAGNSLLIYSYSEEGPSKLEFKDIVCYLDHDV